MPDTGQGMPMDFFPFGPIMWLIAAIVIVLPFWFIFEKAGYSKWLSLLMLIPLVNIIALYFLAFSKWPNLPK
jgi:uncharacterized protein (DUF983 family)